MKTPLRSTLFRLAPFWLLAISSPQAAFSAEEDILTPNDFSATNRVVLTLAEAVSPQEAWNLGLAHAFWERDGRTTVMDVQGVTCRNLSLSANGYPKGYFYFALNRSFKANDVSKVRIDVDYFDGFEGQLGVFGLQYDNSRPDEGTGYSSTALLPNVPLTGSGQWKKASFHVRDATFRNAQNSRSDFRLVASPPELSVSRVAVTLEPGAPASPEPLKFDSEGMTALRTWNIQWDSGAKPAFSRGTNETDRMHWLQILAPGAPCGGSWRTTVFLEPGAYHFLGSAKLTGEESGDTPTGRATLRASGRPGASVVSKADSWLPLEYKFNISKSEFVELVCEFRGSTGRALFDVNSLKLIRK